MAQFFARELRSDLRPVALALEMLQIVAYSMLDTRVNSRLTH